MTTAIQFLMQSQNANDVFFVVGPEKTRIGVVKDLVVKHSNVLHKMLVDSDLKEKGDVVMPDIYPDAVNIFLMYAYGASGTKILQSELESCDTQTALHVVDFTEKYNVPELKDMALEQLRPKDVESLFPALHCVVMYNATPLCSDVLTIIQEKTLEIIQNRAFLELNEECLAYIFQQDRMSASEVDLWKAALAWGKHQGDTDDIKTIRKYLTKPLRHIRLYTLTAEEFWLEVESTGFFSKEEVIDLIRSIITNEFAHSELFSNKTSKRIIPPIAAFVDLQCHADSFQTSVSSTYRLKVAGKRIKLKSLVCYGRTGSTGNYTTTVTITIKQIFNTASTSSAIYSRTCQFAYEEDIVIPLELWGVQGVDLMAGCEYDIFIKFSEACRANTSVSNNGVTYCGGHTFEHGHLSCNQSVNVQNVSNYHSHMKQLHYTYC